jgi:hypothetical protein
MKKRRNGSVVFPIRIPRGKPMIKAMNIVRKERRRLWPIKVHSLPVVRIIR